MWKCILNRLRTYLHSTRLYITYLLWNVDKLEFNTSCFLVFRRHCGKSLFNHIKIELRMYLPILITGGNAVTPMNSIRKQNIFINVTCLKVLPT